MKRKEIWLGMLVIILVFGMTITGCDDGKHEEYKPQFSLNMEITEIPNNRNGETFTMSIIDSGKTMVSKNGTIVNNAAKAKLEWDVGTIITYIHDDGYSYYENSYIGLKIGNDSKKVSETTIHMLVPSDGSGAWRSASEKYTDLFGD